MSNESNINNEVILHGKISATVQIINGSQEAPLVPVTLTFPATVNLIGVYLPPSSNEEPLVLVSGTVLRVPANSMFVVYATGTGGSSMKPTYVSGSANGDLTLQKIYNANSTGTSVKGIAIFTIKTGTEGGEIYLTRSVSGGAVM
jgi:hypothetical protein